MSKVGAEALGRRGRLLHMDLSLAPARTGSTPVPATMIAVAATDPGARMRLREVLERQDQIVVRSGGSAQQLVADGDRCDVVVVHFKSVGSEEMVLLTQLKREFPEVQIVVVCESAKPRCARRAVDGGADGLVFAQELEAALSPTVAAVLAGQTVVPRSIRAGAHKPSLTFREKQILGMVVMGFTNSEIGSRLYLAESTIKSHLSTAFAKLGVRSRSDAAAMILDPHGSLGTGILAITSADWNPPTA